MTPVNGLLRISVGAFLTARIRPGRTVLPSSMATVLLVLRLLVAIGRLLWCCVTLTWVSCVRRLCRLAVRYRTVTILDVMATLKLSLCGMLRVGLFSFSISLCRVWLPTLSICC